jgi:hypothetical protein
MGPSVTRVRSANLDKWNLEWINILENVGNKMANEYWEYSMPKYYQKPNMNSSIEDLIYFTNEKYIKKMFSPKNRINPVEGFLNIKNDCK